MPYIEKQIRQCELVLSALDIGRDALSPRILSEYKLPESVLAYFEEKQILF